MTKKQADRLKAFISQIVTHPQLSDIEKMDKVEEIIDKIVSESKNN